MLFPLAIGIRREHFGAFSIYFPGNKSARKDLNYSLL